MTKILVLGASGYIGSHLVPRLVAAGHAVRAASRRLEVLEGRRWPSVELVAADALAPDTLDEALRGVDVAYYLVHSMGAGAGFADRDRKAAANFRDAAARAGVARIVYVGGLQPVGSQSAHLASRRETGETLREGPVPVIELRAGIVVGAGSAAFEVIRDLVNHLPVMTTPRWVQSHTQPIALTDLLTYLEGVGTIPGLKSAIYDVGGPEVLTYADLIRQYAEVVGKRRLIIALPLLTPRLSSYWLDLVTSVPASVARPLIDGLRHDLLADDTAIRRLVPVGLLPYREAIRSALDDERREPLPARWTEGSLAYRGFDPENSFFARSISTTTIVDAPAEATWDAVRRMGGASGYYFVDSLWRLRGRIDRFVGGVGMRRGRRHPTDIRPGDAIDFWRVVSVSEGARLTLVAEMRVPGAASLELEVVPDDPDRSRLILTASFHPSGVWGLLYWYSLLPIHKAIFVRMPRAIAGVAETSAARSPYMATTQAPFT